MGLNLLAARDLVDRVKGTGILGPGMLIFGASMTLNICGFIFQAIVSRKLGVADYGTLYSMLALYSLVSIPGALLGPVIVKFSAEFRALHDDAHVRGLLVRIVRSFSIAGITAIAVGLLFARPISDFLHVMQWEVSLVGFLVAVGLCSTALRSVAQGTQDFFGYAVSTAGEGVTKVIALLLLLLGVMTVSRGLGAFLLGVGAGLVIISFTLNRRYGRVTPISITLDWRRILVTTGGAAALGISTQAMGYADVLLVKHYLSSNQAGLYAAASLGGRILLYFVGFVPIVLLPKAADHHSRGERTRGTLGMSLVLISGTCVLGVLLYRFFGLYLLHALVGRAFDAALPLLILYAVAMGFLAVTGALGFYGIATHRLAFAIPLLAGTFATLGTIAVVHTSLFVVVLELVFGNGLMCALVGGALAWQGLRGAR